MSGFDIPKPSPGFFGQGSGGRKQWTEMQEQARRRFEDQVVGVLLKRYRLESLGPALYASAEEHTGERWRLVQDFTETVTDFPLHMAVRLLPKVNERVGVASLLTRFESLPPFEEYQLVECEAEHLVQPAVLVFSWPPLRLQVSAAKSAVVLHGIEDLPRLEKTTCIAYAGEGGRKYYIETLPSLLDAIDALYSWRAPDAGED